MGVEGASLPSSRKNRTPKFMPTTPPVPATSKSCLSVRFRGDGHRVWELEWVATRGLSD